VGKGSLAGKKNLVRRDRNTLGGLRTLQRAGRIHKALKERKTEQTPGEGGKKMATSANLTGLKQSDKRSTQSHVVKGARHQNRRGRSEEGGIGKGGGVLAGKENRESPDKLQTPTQIRWNQGRGRAGQIKRKFGTKKRQKVVEERVP